MTNLWTLRSLRRALGLPARGADDDISGVSIDSRTLKKGDVFIALKGETDGHKYVQKAFENGAVAAVVDHDIKDAGGECVVVPDTYRALWAMGDAQRDWAEGAKRVAITGSCGKTTTKEMLAAALGAHKSEGSYNNHWGVPLSLARMPLDSQFGVFEIGMNHHGEIAPLAKLVQPHVAVVTNIAPAHIGHFKSLYDIAIEKLSITEGLQTGGVLVTHENVYQNYKQYFDNKPITYGMTDSADSYAESVKVGASGQTVVAQICGDPISFNINQIGQHHVQNALCALTVAKALNVPLKKAASGIETVRPYPGRGEVFDVNGIYVVDESYNANPVSVAASLEAFKQRPCVGQRIAILGDMLELGDDAPNYHRDLMSACKGLDGVITVGENMKFLHDALPSSLQTGHFDRQDYVNIQKLSNQINGGDMVMVKASKGIFWTQNFVPRLLKELEKKQKGAA